MESHLVQNQEENCHHDHIPFNVKGNGNIVFSVHDTRSKLHRNKYYHLRAEEKKPRKTCREIAHAIKYDPEFVRI